MSSSKLLTMTVPRNKLKTHFFPLKVNHTKGLHHLSSSVPSLNLNTAPKSFTAVWNNTDLDLIDRECG